MDIETRFVAPGELEAFIGLLSDSFGFEPREEDLERFERGFEIDRMFAAFDGSEMVGTGGAFSLRLTVPGNTLATGGTTVIAVSPTHRRPGVLTHMIRIHLDDVAERGEPLAALWASESLIYGRFGYGIAAYLHDYTIKREHGRFLGGSEPPGRTRIAPADEVLPVLKSVYDRVLPTRPGMFGRSDQWWEDRRMYDPEHYRDGATSQRYAVYEEDGVALGYVQYRLKEKWEDGHADGTVSVREMMSATPAAHEALWRYLFGMDLMGTITSWNRPADEELRWLLADPRRIEAKTGDSLWIRLMDVPAAMEARSYSVPGGFVMEVVDEFRPPAGGRWKVEGGPGGGECLPTDRSPDITLGASELGAVYLGGNRLSTLARAGRVAGDEKAIRRADLMLSWDPLPWCQEVF
jgi:predicted acetyltransferase